MQLSWPFPQKKQTPTYISYHPAPIDLSQNFINPFLGYPNSPIIGRYNRGQYKIGQTLFQLQFKCLYDEKTNSYKCGNKKIKIPQLLHHNLRNIPEVIINNKAAGIKNSPEVLPQKFPVRNQLSVFWIVSFGELGKDFLNYLNHMYILASTLFLEEKLQRMVHYLPIYAFLPQHSGLMKNQVQRGLNFNNYRGEYMSFHLNKGAPAFSPNNMRLGVEGGKVVTSKQPAKQDKKPKYIEKQKAEQFKKHKQHKQSKQQQFVLNWSQIQKNAVEKEKIVEKKVVQKQIPNKNQGFIHFYSSLLLEKDYRVYYHWHIEDQLKQEMLKEVWKNSTSLQEFLQKYINFVELDPMIIQAKQLLLPNE